MRSTRGPAAKGWEARYGDQEISQFHSTEVIAKAWGFSREDIERFALESHRRALTAREEGRFDREIVAYEGVEHDEGPRADTTLEKTAGLKPLARVGS